MAAPAAAPRPGVLPPADPPASALPLLDPNFSWERFEEFCHHFVSVRPGVVSCHRYGTRGSDQKGIDLAAVLTVGDEETYQCRQYRRFDAGDVERTVAEQEYRAARHTIVVASVVGTPVRDAIKRRRKWRLLDATDLALAVRTLDAEQARVLVASHFGPDWAERFLGRPALSTFQSPGLYYERQLDRAMPFHHTLDLVGRARELDGLFTFVGDAGQQVYLLAGPGGTGKTRLVIALTAELRAHHPTWHVRVVTDGLAVDATAARELPPGDCLIIVEDAHRRDDLPALLSLARQRPGRTKLVLLARPHGVPSIDGDLAWAGVPAAAVVRARPLARLAETDRLALARAALGPANATQADALVAAAGDSPLVIVVGAHLLASRTVDAATLRSHDVFRRTVLDRFADEAAARFTEGGERDVARKVLRLIAALRPAPAGDADFIDAAATFIGAGSTDVATSLALLEEHGTIERIGRFVRPVPELLADHILRGACITATGAPTGYADRVYAAFAANHGAALLRNLADVDWHLTGGDNGGRRTTLLAGVWSQIRREFDAAPHSGRVRLLESLGAVAFIQPDQVLSIVEAAVSGPSPVPESGVAAAFGGWSHERVLARVPSLLGQIAYHPAHLPRCAELLWRLGREDTRDVNGDHPLNVLRAVAGYGTRAPLVYAEPLMALVERWCSEPGAFARPHTPLDVLDALLAKTASWFRGGARQVTYTAVAVDPDAMAAVHARALELLGRYAASADARTARRALASLGSLMGEPSAPRGGPLPGASVARWEGVRTAAADLVARAAAAGLAPLVAYAARDVLAHHTRYARPGAFRDRVVAALAAVPDTYELRLARAVLEAPWDFDEGLPDPEDHDDVDHAERERRHAAFRLGVAREFLARHAGPEAAAAALASVAAAAQEMGAQTFVGGFWASLTEVDPETSAGIVTRTIAGEHGALVPALDIALRAVAVSPNIADGTAADQLSDATASGDAAVRRAAAQSLWHRPWPGEFSQTFREAFVVLLSDPDLVVRRITVGALASLAVRHQAAALELLSNTDLAGDPHLADDAARLLVVKLPVGTIGLAALTDEYLAAFIERLVDVTTIEPHHLLQLLDRAAARVPRAVVNLFLRRMSRADADDAEPEYKAAPYHWHRHSLNRLSAAADYRDLLSRLRDYALVGRLSRHLVLPKLFAVASNGVDATARDVLLEWLATGDAARIEAAVDLVLEAGDTFVFEHREFVAQAIIAARQAGPICLRNVLAALHRSAAGGAVRSKHGAPGQPFPEDVALRERARAAAAASAPGSDERALYESIARGADLDIERAQAEDVELDLLP